MATFCGHVGMAVLVGLPSKPTLLLDDPRAFRDELEFLGAGPNKRVQIVLTKEKNLRSERANAYYWSTVLTAIEEETKQPAPSIHDAMCQMFLPDEKTQVEFLNKLSGEVVDFAVGGRRSSKLTGEAFFEFVEHVRAWALDFLGVRTPDPDPEYWRKRLVKA